MIGGVFFSFCLFLTVYLKLLFLACNYTDEKVQNQMTEHNVYNPSKNIQNILTYKHENTKKINIQTHKHKNKKKHKTQNI